MFRQTYKTVFSRIRPDEKLLADTKNKMRSVSEIAQLNTGKWMKFGAAAACLVIIATAAVLLTPNRPQLVTTVPESSSVQKSVPQSAAGPEIRTELQNGKYEPVVRLKNGVLNFIDSNVPQVSAKMYFDPEKTHEEQWTQEQVESYLGKDVRPGYLPEVFSAAEQDAGTSPQFIIMNNDGTVAYDNIGYYYYADSDDPASASLEVKASKGKLPRDCVLYRSKEQKKSDINGHAIFVGHEKMQDMTVADSGEPAETYDLYYAEFLYDGVGYRIVSKKLPQEEFVKVLISMVK